MPSAIQLDTSTPGRSAALPSPPSESIPGEVCNSVHFCGLTPSIQKTSSFFYFACTPIRRVVPAWTRRNGPQEPRPGDMRS